MNETGFNTLSYGEPVGTEGHVNILANVDNIHTYLHDITCIDLYDEAHRERIKETIKDVVLANRENDRVIGYLL